MPRKRLSSDALASSESSGARSTRRGRGTVRPSSSPEKRASGRPGWRPSSRDARGDAAFEVLVGRAIDLVGTELPYQPFVEALRPLGEPWQAADRMQGSQLRVFEDTLALLADRAAAVPVLLVLEDLHWADTSTLDLLVFLAHNLDDRRCCCSRPIARTSSPPRSGCAGSRTASGARARRSCSSSGRSKTRS